MNQKENAEVLIHPIPPMTMEEILKLPVRDNWSDIESGADYRMVYSRVRRTEKKYGEKIVYIEPDYIEREGEQPGDEKKREPKNMKYLDIKFTGQEIGSYESALQHQKDLEERELGSFCFGGKGHLRSGRSQLEASRKIVKAFDRKTTWSR